MIYHDKITGLASVAALAIGATMSLTPMTANAATLSLLDPGPAGATRSVPTNHSLGVEPGGSAPGNIAPGMTTADYEALVPDGSGRVGDSVTSFEGAAKKAGNGIFVSENSFVTFTYLGSEAGFTNLAVELLNDSVVFRNRDANSNPETNFAETFTMRFGPGLIPFLYQTEGGTAGSIANNGGTTGNPNLEIAYGAIFNDFKSVNVFFGDAAGDSDLDDLGVRIDVTAVPLPASALLLLGGLGGLSALRRRKRTA